jgi:predicted acetyltransferase
VTDEIVLQTPATEADYPRFVAPISIAFNARQSDAETQNELKTIELDRFVGAFEGSTAVGCAGAFSFGLTVPGGQVSAAGLTSVAVLPTHRRRGILRQMMTWIFDQARARGDPVAILWASEAAIYQRFGYGPGTQQTFFEASTDKVRFLRQVDRPARIRIVGVDEAAQRFPPIYDAIRPNLPGAITRSAERWRWQILTDYEWQRHGNGDKVLVLLEVEGEARGYAIYRHRGDWDASGPKGVVTVTDIAGLDALVEQQLWQWLFGIDLIRTVRGWRGPAPHPIQLMVTEPRRLGMTVSDGTWLRIIDLASALEARSYDRPGQLVMDVTDEFCPSNAGRWILSVPDGAAVGARVTRAPDAADIDLALDIADLAAVYLGAFRFADLARAGRVQECRPGAIDAADLTFRTSGTPSNATMF